MKNKNSLQNVLFIYPVKILTKIYMFRQTFTSVCLDFGCWFKKKKVLSRTLISYLGVCYHTDKVQHYINENLCSLTYFL